MNLEILINSLTNWFQHWIGQRIFRKTKLRYQYKERLSEIIDGFEYAMADRGRACSMVSVISAAMTEEISRNLPIQAQLRAAQVLAKWYAQFRGSTNSMIPGNISQAFDQFARILSETHSIFSEFSQVIANDAAVRDKLKSDSSLYPYFEKIYDQTTTGFEQLCKEARKNLIDEFKEHQFIPLPKL